MFADRVELSYGAKSSYFISFCTVNSTQFRYQDIQDPPQQFVDRFYDFALPVKSGSRCSISIQTGVIDLETGKPGMWFFLGDIVEIDFNHVKVYAGNSYELGVYLLYRDGRDWVVYQRGTVWIS
jgi:hypothetical protein